MLDDATPSGDGQNPRPPFLIPSLFQRHPRALDCFSGAKNHRKKVVRYTALSAAPWCISVSQIGRSSNWLTSSIFRGLVLGPM